MGRTALNAFRTVLSTYPRIMKFLTTEGIGMLKKDQTDARQCCAVIVKNSKWIIGVALDKRRKTIGAKEEYMASLLVEGA